MARLYIAGMIRPVTSRWQGAVLVCGKCSKRIDGGFGKKGRKPLAQVLRKLGIGGKGRKAVRGVVETGCLGLCPKQAVVAIDTRAPGRWLVVPAGTPAERVAAALAPEGPPASEEALRPHIVGDPAG